jgi:uncharacterized protein (TIGR00255 family)
MPIRSMTGFARVRGTCSSGEVVITLKSVNHRGLDLHFHLPPDFDPYEHAIRNVVRKHAVRGHIDIRAHLHRHSTAGEAALNLPLLDAYVHAWRAAAQRHGITAPPDLATAFRLPSIFGPQNTDDPDAEMEAFLVQLTEQALAELNAFREREGRETIAVLRGLNASIREHAAVIRDTRSRAIPFFQARLAERLSELLQGANLEPQRLAQEAAILADRSDIGEELARLEIHTNELEQLLSSSGEVGKKLDFLLQEMNREANTTLSKTNGIGEQGLGITKAGLAIKAAIEKIREQSLNLE